MWKANIDRNFSWITIPDGTQLPPVVARDLSEENCLRIVHAVNSEEIIQEVFEERARQDQQCGGAKHDDTHSPLGWMEFAVSQCEHVGMGVLQRGASYYSTPDCRQRFVKLAAIAFAALESFDRKNNPPTVPQPDSMGGAK